MHMCAHTNTQAVWASYQQHKQIYKRDRWTDTRGDTNGGDRWIFRMDDGPSHVNTEKIQRQTQDTKVHVSKYIHSH